MFKWLSQIPGPIEKVLQDLIKYVQRHRLSNLTEIKLERDPKRLAALITLQGGSVLTRGWGSEYKCISHFSDV